MISIIIPHFRTEQYIRICLRSLRKYTYGDYEVIVIDNNSSDDSIKYLRTLKWIKLIENPTELIGGQAHKEALDIGIKHASGDWLCFFHSDTIVLKQAWDMILMEMIKESNAVGLAPGDRDINCFRPWVQRFSLQIREVIRNTKYQLHRKPAIRKVMSFCFIIKADIIKNSGISFSSGKKDVICDFYKNILQDQYPFLLVGRKKLEPLLWHTSNITSILTGQLTESRLIRKFDRKNHQLIRQQEIKKILGDSSLDR